MSGNNTLFMTHEESHRVQNIVRGHLKKLEQQANLPWETMDSHGLIQQATSASLMQDLSSAAFGLGTPKSKETMLAYDVGRPYPPCATKLRDLKHMRVSELKMESHHRGFVLALRRVSPVAELEASSWAVFQGESPDEVERLEVFLHKSKNGRDLLDMSSELLVKEPYYTLNHQGERTIRVDHPSDLVFTLLSENPESWRQRRHTAEDQTKPPEKCKEMGNAALKKKDFLRAHAYYTQGLHQSIDATDTLIKDLYRNRSHVNLLLQRFDEARSDAALSLTDGADEALDAKAYYRAGLAAYSLGDFDSAKYFFELQENLQANSHAKLNLRRTEARLQQQSTGTYEMAKIVRSLSKNQGRPDVASFYGDIEIKASPGAGRGLFATRDIGLNEIIMCEKAFCVVWSYEPEAFSSLTCDTRDDAKIRVFPSGLHKVVVEKLLNNPSQIERVLDLFGDYSGLGKKLVEVDGKPVVDTFQIHDIIQRNAFGPGQQTEDEDISNASTGLWIMASYMNHSCVPNAKKDYIGDLMIVRATRRIIAGEEILQRYDESTDHDVRTASLQRTWGFRCKCSLCLAEEADGPAIREMRKGLEDKANRFIHQEKAAGANRILIHKAKRLRQGIYETYDRERYKDLPRSGLIQIERWLEEADTR
ncbi:uncharacterized protein NECHADRAFT_122942 [Fusarium vanettenii 77-13-4]|uniref:SET domain-containing protein n=1 Tax=Fusarium vanettenii (strain ATCC MYA-4622 / CBS 123669 / FGSC 9596 / NRRL 45880 / 77-13-4) TaxID=660122 RepID=C7ZIE0_FUSV7|nr:uncharacterized protein NECHADRAFT_122942 [Fusarium vanettenii 77-13-4]EEU36245.1 hypothetical protein NECHADRAFT_122942 [Fusarium vanettenii 77-13-4]